MKRVSGLGICALALLISGGDGISRIVERDVKSIGRLVVRALLGGGDGVSGIVEADMEGVSWLGVGTLVYLAFSISLK